MNKYEVTYISGHTLRYSVVRVIAASEREAVKKAFELEGQNFDNRQVSVKVVK